MERRSFIKVLAVSLVLPKIPAVRELNPAYATALTSELVTSEQSAGYWKFVEVRDKWLVFESSDYVDAEKPS